MAAADAPTSVASAQNEQLTAPPGWTKKLVPAKAKNATLRKHDVVFIAPDGQEIPSQWHLRRYLKAHPSGPGFSDFSWSSGEESIRRSARAPTKEITYSEKTIRGKRNASEMDAGGTDESKVKSPVRKRAKKAVESDVSEDKEALPIKDELQHEVPQGAANACDGVVEEASEPGVVQEGEADINTGKDEEIVVEEQLSKAETAEKLTDVVMDEKSKVEDVLEHIVMEKDVANHEKPVVDKVIEQVVIIRNETIHEKPTGEEVIEQVVIVRNETIYEKPIVEEEVIEQVLNAIDLVTHENPILKEDIEQLPNSADATMFENPKVEEVLERIVEVQEKLEEVIRTTAELQPEELDLEKVVEDVAFIVPTYGLDKETPTLNSDELQGASDAHMVESDKLLDQNIEDPSDLELKNPIDIEVVDAVIMEAKEPLDQDLDVTDAVMAESKAFDPIMEVADAVVVESKKPLDENLEVPDGVTVESKKLLNENSDVTENVEKASLEVHDHQDDDKLSMEPLMQKEEQERMSNANNSQLKVEYTGEKSSNEMCSSTVPVRIFNQ